MISAFGVVHKAQVSPGKFKPITELNPIQREKLKRRVEYGAGKPVVGYGRTRGKSSRGRRIWGEERSPTPKSGLVVRDLTPDEVGTKVPGSGEPAFRAGFAQPNGRGGGLIAVNSKHPNRDKVLAHEMEHIKPRRNPDTFARRITRSPTTHGREEGRADFLSHGRPTPGQYPGDEGFQAGYTHVQNRMMRAQQRKKRSS